MVTMKRRFAAILQLVGATAQVTTTPCHFDCQVGLGNWRLAWGLPKIEWCCKHEKVACETTAVPTTTSCHFDCQAGLNNWKLAWAEPKKRYCCKHEGIACETTATPSTTSSCHFDCQAGLNNWKLAWAEPKKKYCCKHEGIACPETTAAPTTAAPTTAAPTTAAPTTAAPTTIAPTTAAPTTAATTLQSTTSCQFDCQAGLKNWKLAWAEPKKKWCCERFSVACETTAVPSTTSCRFDCQAGLNNWKLAWAEPKKLYCCKHEGIACPDTMPPPAHLPEVMTCHLACFGEGASPVILPGSVGIGAGASLNDVSRDACRRACVGQPDCEAIMFTNHTKGTPFKTMCYGKRNIHTSKCQPGGDFVTEIIGDAPKVTGKCAIFGDPHIITFDRVYGPDNTITAPGEYYLIKSQDLNVHGRFGYTHRFPTASSALGIAVGGSMIKGHTLIVTFVGPERGYKGFKVLWDGATILEDYPSTFSSDDGVLKAAHDAMDPQKYHREGRHTIGGTEGLLPSYRFDLAPDICIYVLIGPDNCNVVIKAPKMAHAQDGWCGNFNCDQDDDSVDAIQSRGVAGELQPGRSLFASGPQPPAWTMRKVAAPSLEDCSPERSARAEEECADLEHGERGACIYDICATDEARAATHDVDVEALPYNCREGSPAAWPKEQQSWCCEKEKVCQGDAQPARMANPCDEMCSWAGRTATCKERVYWAATHKFLNQPEACNQALDLVKGQCQASCAGCELGMTDCSVDGQPHMHFWRRFELEPRASAATDSERHLEVTMAGAQNRLWQAAGLVAGCALLASGLVIGRLRSRGRAAEELELQLTALE